MGPDRTEPAQAVTRSEVLGSCQKLGEARQSLAAHVFTYEQLTAEPERGMRG
ncbi:hypothetical protein M878_06960 [Streptomyces roseochromogenus subsp. oscitans DS 12.976]|uniref:Uncharacterized protein n=1 Tax=Streptomyces roseochromogenus subsp. oscitans DS 12.976 TaxID=1352936 RepID=V6L1X0_STRRC|nr:hypothetical protein M878_06960 [Streptomyces roseochromogenus subsp. oscitans DS 12.976]